MKAQLTLWDWIQPVIDAFKPAPRPSPVRRPKPSARKPKPSPTRAPAARSAPAHLAPVPSSLSPAASAQARYDQVARAMLAHYKIRVRKWRSGMSGIAWYVTYRDGSTQRLIEAPRPKGPMSAAVFLHEIGHHAIGFNVYKPRCLEEYHAWRWALDAMQTHGLNITDSVRRRMHMSLWYAVSKAKRRGIREIPGELAPFLEKPPRRPRRSARI